MFEVPCPGKSFHFRRQSPKAVLIQVLWPSPGMELGSWASGQTSSPAGLTSGDTGGRVTSFRPGAEIEQAAPISSCCEPGASKLATASLQTDLEGHGKFHSTVLSPVGGVVRRPLPPLCLSLFTDQGQRHFRLVGRDTDPRDSDSVGWGRGRGERELQVACSPGICIDGTLALPGKTWWGPAPLCSSHGWGSKL